MSRAFEFAITPIIFGAAGYGLDALFGTRPFITIGFATFAVVGLLVRTWYGYDAEMRSIESKSAWSADRARETAPAFEPGADLWEKRRAAPGLDR